MDIKSKDILKQALKAYDGTLLVVSHDRDFLEGLVDKMYEFRDGKVMEHVGSVSEFLEKRKIENLQELERRFGPSENHEAKPQEQPAGKKEYEAMKAVSKEEKKLKNRIGYLENEIGRVEKRQKAIEAVLAAPGKDDDIMELTREYLENQRDLEAWTDEWGTLVEKMDN
jgi:ATP-binding cassette subfamily F protein 3